MYLNFGMRNIYIRSNEILYEVLVHYNLCTRKIINGENMTNLDQGEKKCFCTSESKGRNGYTYNLSLLPRLCTAQVISCGITRKKIYYKVCSYKIIVRRENHPGAYYQRNIFHVAN